MSQAIIRAAIEQRLKTWADAEIPAVPIAYQNAPFVPPAGPYIRAFLLPAETNSPFLEGGSRTYIGVYQLSVCAPETTGSAVAEALLAELEALFTANLRVLQSGVTVIVTSPVSASPAMQEPGLYVIPCRFRYRADVT